MTVDREPPEPIIELSEADREVLSEAKHQIDSDIKAGRFKPGERRCVVVPSGARFHMGYPEQRSSEHTLSPGRSG